MASSPADRVSLHRGDITRLDVDAIVNAANEALLPGGGVCGAIHRAAGPQLAAACRPLAPCPPGGARLTPGFRLPARHVIHAVGPVWQGGGRGEPQTLAACYRSTLALCVEHGLDSVAFPAISTGIFGYPLEAATEVAVDAVLAHLVAHDGPLTVTFCVFDAAAEAAYRRVLDDRRSR